MLALTLVTTLLGFLDLGPFSMLIAVLIAALKGMLIVAIFMHALHEHKEVHVIIVGGVVWLTILFSLTIGDYITRGWLPFPSK